MSKKRRGDRSSSGAGRPSSAASGKPRPGSSAGTGAPAGGAGASSTGKRAPRIGRRTLPPGPRGAAPDAVGAAGDGAAPRAAGGDRALSGSLRSAGTRSGRTAPRPAPPRAAGPDQRQAPRGAGLFSAFRAPSVYPKLGETLAAGGRAVLGSPVLVGGSMLVVLILWFGMLAVGLGHVPQFFQNVMAIPPLSTLFDLNSVFSSLGLTVAAALITLALTAIRAGIWAIVTSLVVERLDTDRVSVAGLRRGFRSAPAFLGIFFAQLALIYFSQFLRLLLGASFGGLAFFGALVGGVYLLAFAPIIVIRDGASARAAMGRSSRAARLPGSRHVGMVLLYFTGAFLLPLLVPMSSAFTVNPTLATWTLVLAVTLFHLVSLGGFAYRYGVIEDDVPEAPPRRARTRPSLLGRR
ncbi:MAG: hypothetical protein ACJ77A_11640 [Actinomycetota bacterium]